MISVVSISIDDSEGVVLAKVMKVAKEIRPGYKNAGPLRLGAGRLLAFLGAGDARRKEPAAGVMVCGVRWGGQ